MIKCECGADFPTACEHAQHKMVSKYPDNHRTLCSSCETILGRLEPNFKGLVISKNNRICFVYCEACRDQIVELYEMEKI